MKRTFDVLFAAVVACMLVGFLVYSAAPIFGLNELWPTVFADGNRLGWGLLVVLMLIGGLYWRGFWIKSRKRQRRRSD
ncbi:hypothetical protein [Anianabacter salinae]|uniref:hypothetical protein n=1 Tax=Anianabacter salinae TaxID=2851023 RepID=UPI00225E2519|nr:hypothetical protein [Anianabacter salinae]MBV0913056.1 hypothetical protein [Anianabacter salinae]